MFNIFIRQSYGSNNKLEWITQSWLATSLWERKLDSKLKKAIRNYSLTFSQEQSCQFMDIKEKESHDCQSPYGI